MAGKHQIRSSRKSTRQKANRSWRRQAKLASRKLSRNVYRYKDSLPAPDFRPEKLDVQWADYGECGDSLGEILKDAMPPEKPRLS